MSLIRGDARHLPLADCSVDCCVTSPPYFGLRDYNQPGQIGLEDSPLVYIDALVSVFRDVRRVLKDDGVLWLNLGDSYAGSWGAQGRPQGATGEMATRSVISARQIGSHPRFEGLTGTRGREMGLKSKDLMMIPARAAMALQADGWYLRSDVIWHKPNPMPESVTDRPTKSHEYLFLLTKSERYHYDADAIAEPCSAAMLAQMEQGYEGLGLKDYAAAGVQNPSSVKARIIAGARKRAEGKHAKTGPQDPGRRMVENVARARAEGADHESPFGLTRNRRTVWTINTQPYREAHFAVMPEALVEPCIRAGCPEGGLVLDPFAGAGTVGVVAEKLRRRFVGVELNPDYIAIADRRIRSVAPLFREASA